MGRSSICVALFLSVKYTRLMSLGYRFGRETFSSLLSSYFSPVLGLQAEKTEGQRTLPQKSCLGLSGNPNWDSNCPCGGLNNSCLSTTSDYSGFSRNSDHWSKRWDGGQETKRRGKTVFSNLSLGSYAQSSQRDWGTATQAVASLWNTHWEK